LGDSKKKGTSTRKRKREPQTGRRKPAKTATKSGTGNGHQKKKNTRLLQVEHGRGEESHLKVWAGSRKKRSWGISGGGGKGKENCDTKH